VRGRGLLVRLVGEGEEDWRMGCSANDSLPFDIGGPMEGCADRQVGGKKKFCVAVAALCTLLQSGACREGESEERERRRRRKKGTLE